MKAYSEDLRKKIVEAIEQRGMNKCQAARNFDVSLPTVKRYARNPAMEDHSHRASRLAELRRWIRGPGSCLKRTLKIALPPPSPSAVSIYGLLLG
jgi:transposase-like protein